MPDTAYPLIKLPHPFLTTYEVVGIGEGTSKKFSLSLRRQPPEGRPPPQTLHSGSLSWHELVVPPKKTVLQHPTIVPGRVLVEVHIRLCSGQVAKLLLSDRYGTSSMQSTLRTQFTSTSESTCKVRERMLSKQSFLSRVWPYNIPSRLRRVQRQSSRQLHMSCLS